MDEESESGSVSGIDLASGTKKLAKERVFNSIRLRRPRQSPATRIASTATPVAGDEDQLGDAAHDAENKYTPEIIVSVFNSNDLGRKEIFATELAQSCRANPEFSIIRDPELITFIVNSAPSFSTETAIRTYYELIMSLISKNESEIIDEGLLFILRDQVFSEFPLETLNFYSSLAETSNYGRNAMMITGVLEDLIECCKTSEDESIAVGAASVLRTMFEMAEDDPPDADLVSDSIPQIISLLESQFTGVVSAIAFALVDMSSFLPNVRSILYKHNVEAFVAQMMGIPELLEPALCLASDLATCEPNEFLQFQAAGLIDLAKSLVGGEHTGDAFWVLLNCLETSPQIVLPQLDWPFLVQTAQLLREGNFAVVRSAACFVATLLVFAPDDFVRQLLTLDVCGPIVEMLDCGESAAVLRCLDGLRRVELMAFCDAEVVSSAVGLFGGDGELEDALGRLEHNDDARIGSRVAQIQVDLEELQPHDE